VKETISYGDFSKLTLYDEKMEVQLICCFWRNCRYVYESKISRYEGTVLAANLDKPITGETSRVMRSLSQELIISGTTVGKMVSGMDQISENLHYIFHHER
jgi:hypothetical protein